MRIKYFKILIIISGVIILFFVYQNYTSSLTHNLQKIGLSSKGLYGFKVDEQINFQEQVIVAKKNDEQIKIKITPDVSNIEVLKLISKEEEFLTSMYDSVLYPYPEFLDKKNECVEEYKPIKKEHGLGEYFLLYAKENFNYGACEEKEAKYKILLTFFYLEEENIFLELEYSISKQKRFSSMEEIINTIKADDEVLSLAGRNQDDTTEKEFSQNDTNKNKIEIFSVAGCPFTRDLVHALALFLKKTNQEIRDSMDIKISYYGKEYEKGKFISYHGKEEPKLNILELCIIDKYPDNLEYFYIIDCLFQKVNLSKIDESITDLMGSWETCTKDVAVNKNDEVKKCASSEEGKDLYRESIAYITTKKYAKFPPILRFNDKNFPTVKPDAFRLELCKKLDNSSLECLDIPECYGEANCQDKKNKASFCMKNKCEYGDKIKMIVLTDDFTDTENNYAIEWYSLLYGEFDVEHININSFKGSQLAKELNLLEFPVILIDDRIEKINRFKERFGYTRLIFSNKKNNWYIVDHDRFSFTNAIIRDQIQNAEGIHFRDSGLKTSDKMKEYFGNRPEFYKESKEYFNENFLQ
ncbi:hypothetical protein HOD96_02350 [Candidatus Falkowbacteria bacterium]|jgi:hypothetical protein|nr:hypothetical protein [Candidatus Falkowbacteria bacterium]MBT4433452.1 hypothetical protein [Candidatus Falkowbacteria bacterium]